MSQTVPTYSVSHIGMCVSDLERSLRFYCDGLGFERGDGVDIDSRFADALEVPGAVEVRSQFVRTPGLSIELLGYSTPGVHGSPSTARNQLGITHLSFVVPDVETASETLVRCGGTLLEGTRTKALGVDLVFVADPDGVRVELMAFGT